MNITTRRAVVLLTCGGLILALAVGMRQSFGLFLIPMSADLGWNREVFAFAIALQNIVWGVTQPAVAMIADRFGSARVIAISGVIYAVGLFMMASTTSPGEIYFSAGVLIGLALSGTGFVVVLGTVGRAFPAAKRSLVIGIVGAGGSFGQFVMAPIGQGLIGGWGWPAALVGFAVLGALTVLLAAPLRGRAAGVVGERELGMRPAIMEAGHHSGYLYLNAGFFVCGFQVTFIIGHLPAYLTDTGLSPTVAATALGLIGLFNIVGSLVWGALGDHYRKKHLLSLMYFSRAALILLLVLLPPSPGLAYIFTAIMGLLWLGTIPLTSALIAQIFGARYLTSLFGIVFLSHQLGAFLGVWLGGLAFDAWASYAPVWWICIGLGVLAGVLHLPINDRPLPAPARA